MPYTCFDHTGDIGIDVDAGDPGELFAEAARALTDIMTEHGAVVVAGTRQVTLAAATLDLLLVDWLSEILYIFDTKRWFVARAEVVLTRGDDGYALDATLGGEPFDPARHPVKLTLKAVTYHALELAERDGAWRARVVFDV